MSLRLTERNLRHTVNRVIIMSKFFMFKTLFLCIKKELTLFLNIHNVHKLKHFLLGKELRYLDKKIFRYIFYIFLFQFKNIVAHNTYYISIIKLLFGTF